MNRVLLVLAVVVVFVVGFVVLRPSDDDQTSGSAGAPTASTTSPQGATPTTSVQADPGAQPTPELPPPTPKPKVPTIEVKALKPVGGVREIKLDKGDLLRLRVRSDRAENVHLHGYDIAKPVAPGRPASFSVRAKIEGIFELELEESGVPIAEVTVNP